ncbi:hypothetical protein QTP70_033442, partial [Hemibagrus guttatus]
ANKPWLAGCDLYTPAHWGDQREAHHHPAGFWEYCDPWLGQLVCHDQSSQQGLLRSCVHGNAQTVPSAQVRIGGPAGEWPLLVGLIPDLPVPLLLGHDWPRFKAAISTATWKKSSQKAKSWCGRLIWLGRTGELMLPPLAIRSFGKEQKENDWLKHCWCQVCEINRVNTDPTQCLPTSYFTVRNGLLYYHMEWRGQSCGLLVVPRYHGFCSDLSMSSGHFILDDGSSAENQSRQN